MPSHTRTGIIDPSTITITDEPYRGRASTVHQSKYEGLFSQALPNKRIKCPQGTSSRIASLFRKWLIKNGQKEPIIRSVDEYGDGMGGVWWIKESEKPKSVWRGLDRKAA